MLEKVAGEDEVEGVVLEGPCGGAVLKETLNAGSDAFGRFRVEVHRVSGFARDLVDEFAVTATKVEHCVAGLDVARKSFFDKHSPDRLAILCAIAKAPFVNALQIFR